jgi:hypothetical protein
MKKSHRGWWCVAAKRRAREAHASAKPGVEFQTIFPLRSDRPKSMKSLRGAVIPVEGFRNLVEWNCKDIRRLRVHRAVESQAACWIKKW